MNRFTAALTALQTNDPGIETLIAGMYAAMIEASTYEKDVNTDPAVLLFAMQITFKTNIDFATPNALNVLAERCQENAMQPIIPPNMVN